MEKDNKYYSLIENLVRSHKKFPGYEPILDEIINDVYAHSEVIIGSINNEKVINAYLEKVISTSIITVPKKLRFIPAIQYRRPSVQQLIKPEVKTEYVDKMINTSFVPEKTEEILAELQAEEPVLENKEEEPLIIEQEEIPEEAPVVELEPEEELELSAPLIPEEEDIIEAPAEITEELVPEEPEQEEEIFSLPEDSALTEEEQTLEIFESPQEVEELDITAVTEAEHVQEDEIIEEEPFTGPDFTDLSAFEPISENEDIVQEEPEDLLELSTDEPALDIPAEEEPILAEADEVFDLVEESTLTEVREEEELETLPEEEEASLEEFTLEEEEPAIDFNLSEEEPDLELEEAPQEIEAEENTDFVPTDYSRFGERLNSEQAEEEDFTYDAEELSSEIEKLDSKRPELNIVKVYNLKYKENASVPQIANQLEMSESSVIDALCEIVALV